MHGSSHAQLYPDTFGRAQNTIDIVISLKLLVIIAIAPRSFEGLSSHLRPASTAIGQCPTRSPNVSVLSPINRFCRKASKEHDCKRKSDFVTAYTSTCYTIDRSKQVLDKMTVEILVKADFSDCMHYGGPTGTQKWLSTRRHDQKAFPSLAAPPSGSKGKKSKRTAALMELMI